MQVCESGRRLHFLDRGGIQLYGRCACPSSIGRHGPLSNVHRSSNFRLKTDMSSSLCLSTVLTISAQQGRSPTQIHNTLCLFIRMIVLQPWHLFECPIPEALAIRRLGYRSVVCVCARDTPTTTRGVFCFQYVVIEGKQNNYVTRYKRGGVSHSKTVL